MVLACLAQGVSSCAMPQLTRVSEQDFPRAPACEKCHVDIAREWAASPHAAAFRNPRFRQATDDYRFPQCLGCHAPQPGYSTTRPAVRQAAREEGVTCVCCHLEEGTMAGPMKPTGLASPHPVKVAPASYRDSGFCGRCHEGTFRQWQASTLPRRPSCQECHMPQVHRKMTQATGLVSEPIVAAEKAGDERRHTFDLAPANADPPLASFSLRREGGRLVLSLRNDLPHNLPTGDYGVRVITVSAEALNAQRLPAPCGQWELTSAGEGKMASEAQRQWKTDPPPGTTAIRVRLVRSGRDGANSAVLMETEVPLP
jgi:hypothetical protein